MRIAIIMLILAFASDLYKQVYKVPFILRALFTLFHYFPRITVGLLFIEFLKGRLSKIPIFLLLGLAIPYLIIRDFATGLLAPLFLDISLLLFLFWYIKRKIPIWGILLGLLFLFPLFSAKNEYRRYVWFGTYRYANAFKKTELFFNILAEDLKEHKLKMFKDGFEVFIKRANHLSEFAICIEETPSIIPYWHGHSLKPLLTAVIPRFIMPWKPVESMGQEYGHRYNFLNPNDYGTSINLPMLIELYINFGAIGIIIGMFLIGVVYRILYRIMNYEGMGEGVAVIGAIIFMNLMNIESNISLVFGNVVENTIIMYLIFLVLKIRKE